MASAVLLCTQLLTSNAAWADHDVTTHGYFRIGAGYSGKFKDRACYQAPGASWKFRLGNECDTWIEGGIHDNFRPKGEDGPLIHSVLWIGMSMAEGRFQPIRYMLPTQLYTEVSNLAAIGKDTKLWVGRKYYQRHDIHINDFYWSEMLIDGFGVEDIRLGPGKLMYALGRSVQFTDTAEDAYQNNHDIRYNMPFSISGKGSVTVQGLFAHSGGTDVSEPSYGFMAAAWLEESFEGLWDKLSVQYCGGISRWECRAWNPDTAAVLTDDAGSDLLGAYTLRITNQTLINPDPRWALFAALVFQKQSGGDFDNRDITWYALGLRPMYFLNENFRVLAEYGFDRTENKTDPASEVSGNLHKLTLAGEFSTDYGFWNRPVLRAFGTFAAWSDEFRNSVGDSGNGKDTPCSNETSCFSFGVQAEYWW